MSNEVLFDAFRHNCWATKHLLAVCKELSAEQLTTSVTGTYGDIPATFDHIIRREGSYLRRLAGSAPDWVDGEPSRDLDELTAWADELGELWERLLATSIDPERVYVVDDGANEVRAGIFLAQVFHHGSVHREQVCSILTHLGIEPPDSQPWEYAWETGRIWERAHAES